MLMDKNDLHKYQIQAIDFIKQKKKVGLWLEMGLGKSITTLTAISELLTDGLIKNCLIIAPLRVAINTWSAEIDKWQHINNIKVVNFAGANKEQRFKGLSTPHNMVIINFDALAWLMNNYNNQFDCIIIDESSMIKDPSTNRFSHIKKLTLYSEYVVCLTGTPSPNSIKDLWSQIYVLDRGIRLSDKFGIFKQQYFNISPYNQHIIKPRDGSYDIVTNKIKDIVISMKAEDYIEVPEKIIIDLEFQMDKTTSEIYKRLEKELVIILRESQIITPNIMALTNKLMQLCNGFIYNDEREGLNVNTSKLDIIKEVVETNPDETIIIFHYYKHDLYRLQQEFPEAKTIKDKNVIAEWNKGKVKILLANPKSAGHGLNLQSGGRMIIWFNLTYSLESYLQANARLHRQGQMRPVKILRLVCKNSIESKIKFSLDNKDKQQQSLMEFLKASYLE